MSYLPAMGVDFRAPQISRAWSLRWGQSRVCSLIKHSDVFWWWLWGLPPLPPPDGSVTVCWPSLQTVHSWYPPRVLPVLHLACWGYSPHFWQVFWIPVPLFSGPPPYLLMSLLIFPSTPDCTSASLTLPETSAAAWLWQFGVWSWP